MAQYLSCQTRAGLAVAPQFRKRLKTPSAYELLEQRSVSIDVVAASLCCAWHMAGLALAWIK